MVKNGQKMRFFGPKMTLFAAQSRPKQPKNPPKMHKPSRHIVCGLIGPLFSHLFAFNWSEIAFHAQFVAKMVKNVVFLTENLPSPAAY
jgi:hypothetical protein